MIGKVNADLSVRVMASTDFGAENDIGMSSSMLMLIQSVSHGEWTLIGGIDFNAYEALVDATHRYSEIFYSKET